MKKQVIAAAVFCMIAVIAVVFVANYIQTGAWIPGQKNTSVSTENQANESESDLDEGQIAEALKNAELYGLDPDKDPNAFVTDEAFFDPELEESDPNVQANLLVSSVEKDLRVSVVNGNGELVREKPIRINVTNAAGEQHHYKDADQDGILYIAPIEEGEYQVSADSIDGYLPMEEQVPVNVKAQLDYTVVDDISYLIKSEDEIDEVVEDTAVNGAENDADGTESNKRLEDEDAIWGIDVSKWNKEIDWARVKAAGVDFAIIRCGYRGSKTGSLVEDPYFLKNIEGAQAADVKVGIYFFTQAVSEVEAVEEASMAVMLCRGYKLALPIFIDTEGAGGSGRADALETETRTAVCEAFCKTIENAGYNAGVYASKNWYEHNLLTDRLGDYTFWLAQYSSRATYKGDYDIWQYTSAGTVDGIETRVDLNLCYWKFE